MDHASILPAEFVEAALRDDDESATHP